MLEINEEKETLKLYKLVFKKYKKIRKATKIMQAYRMVSYIFRQHTYPQENLQKMTEQNIKPRCLHFNTYLYLY